MNTIFRTSYVLSILAFTVVHSPHETIHHTLNMLSSSLLPVSCTCKGLQRHLPVLSLSLTMYRIHGNGSMSSMISKYFEKCSIIAPASKLRTLAHRSVQSEKFR